LKGAIPTILLRFEPFRGVWREVFEGNVMSNWPGDDAVFPFCLPIIKQFEGFRAAPYLDSVGVATIGYGTIRYPDGSAVTMKDPACNDAEATSYVSHDMATMSAVLAPLLTRPATLHQAAAMLSLSYNIGTGAFKSSTVLRQFNAGDIPDAADAFLMWDKGTVNGQKVVIEGLHNRRVQERTIFLTAD
jgi:lysozyme